MTRVKFHRGKTIASALLLVSMPSFVLTGIAGAQEIEEVIVTATKRAKSTQDIPISITAISSEDLSKSGIGGLEEYAYLSPGLAISGQGFGRTQINIRGISPGEIRRDNIRAQETVGIYLDEMPLSTSLYNPDLEPFDLQQVEVLRGPQGTLYGAGSLSGTLRLITNAPVMNEVEGAVDATYSTISHGDESFALKGALNIPLVEDTLAARVVVYHTDEGGWIDNLAPTEAGGDDINTSEKTGGRLALLWQPNDQLSLRLNYITQSIDAVGTPADFVSERGVTRLESLGGIPAGSVPDWDREYESFYPLEERYEDDIDIFNLTLNYSFDTFDVTSSSTFIEREVLALADISVTSGLGVGLLNAFTGSPQRVELPDNKDIESFSQEIRLTSTGEGDLEWIAGVYFATQEVGYFQPLGSPDPSSFSAAIPGGPLAGTSIFAPFGVPDGRLLDTRYGLENDQIAVFGEVIYNFSDEWSLTAGLRWFDIDQDYFERSLGFLAGTFGGTPAGEDTQTSENDINPKLLLTYTPNGDNLFSAQVSRGFRFGGPQSFIPLGPAPGCSPDLAGLGLSDATLPGEFESESLWNYELTWKSSLSERTQLNVALFYIDYQDIQITTRLANCGFSFTSNGAEATSQGVEFELISFLTENLKVNFGGSYTDAELEEDLPSNEALAGDPLVYVPELKLNAGVGYERTVNDNWEFYGQLFWQFTDEQETLQTNRPRAPGVDSVLDAYDTINLRFGLVSEAWELAVFANNLTDEYATTYLESLNPGGPGGVDYVTTIRPRNVGLNVKYRF